MKKILISFVLLFSLTGYTLYAQKGIVSVNQPTGSAVASIPIYNITKGAVSMPVNLIYTSNGVKIKDIEGTAGMGWNLQAGGVVSRLMHGLPDDCKKDASNHARFGWLYNTKGTAINSFNIANSGDGNCTNEATDISYINTNFSDLADTEPDIFSVSAPGLSCELVFDSDHAIHPISYQDLDIKLTYNTTSGDPMNGAITSFTITNDRGVKYVFDRTEQLAQQSYTSTVNFGTGTATYYTNKYNQYSSRITYYDKWYLTSVTDANGVGIVLGYATGYKRVSWDDVIYYNSSADGVNAMAKQFTIQNTLDRQILTSVKTNDNGVLTDALSIVYVKRDLNSITPDMIQTISCMGRDIHFDYERIGSKNAKDYIRSFLAGYRETGCNSPVSYKFDYNKVTNGTIAIGDSSSYHTDFWGYYSNNGFVNSIPALYVNPLNPFYQRYAIKASGTPGADYTYTLTANDEYADPDEVATGMLSKITYLEGGNTSIAYEANDYLDVPSATVIKGGGARVKTVTDYDGNDVAKNIVTNYSYLNPSTGKSSGEPITLPAYGFTTPYTGSATGLDYWNYSTVRSADDLSEEDHSIMYGYVKMSQTGAGSVLSNFYVTATNWDNNSAPVCSGCINEWQPTVDYVARPLCQSYGSVKNDIDSYPFAPNPNYDFERGQILKQTTYNDAGTEVSESVYTYQRPGALSYIYGLRWEKNLLTYAYAKYMIYYTNNELVSQVTKKVFDSSTLTQAQTSTTNYTYGTTYHKLAKQQTTNSDGSVLTTNIRYSKENYSISTPGSDSTANGIYHLQHLNINIPIETYTQVTRGATTKTISAQFTRFKTFIPAGGTYVYMPSQSLKLVAADGISFTPYSLTGGTATGPSTSYYTAANYTAYDKSGQLLTADDGNKHISTVVTDHLTFHPVAVFKNASSAQIGFEDFDSTLPSGINYTLSGPFDAETYSHTGNGYTFGTGQTISKAVQKKTGENFYILSAWIRSTAGSGSLNVTLTPTSGTAVSYTANYAKTTGTPTAMQYFEWQVPVSAITTSTFTMSFSTSRAIYIDDIIFYPMSAEVTTAAFDPVTYFPIAQTNTNGVSAYSTNDQWGRMLYRYDQDKNIVERKTYYNANSSGLPVPLISATPNPSYLGNSVAINVQSNSCISNVTYNWNFGDGTTATTVDVTSQTHTYSDPGTYTIKVTASQPDYGSKNDTQEIQVLNPPVSLSVCQSGVTLWDNVHGVALHQATCLSNPNDDTHAYYTVNSVIGTTNPVHYQWQKSTDVGGVDWYPVGTDTNQYIEICRTKGVSYRIRCLVTVENTEPTQVITSSSMFFDVVN